ncbi:MAG: hypothetical protein ACTS77_01315 [Arsenophonus sp. NC-TX2-MAG3]
MTISIPVYMSLQHNTGECDGARNIDLREQSVIVKKVKEDGDSESNVLPNTVGQNINPLF